MVFSIQAADFVNTPIPPKGMTALYDSLTLDQVVVTATHTPKALKDVPVVTRLISLDDIKKADATNIQDLLVQELPGLEFGFAMTQETSLNMSGFGGNAILFLCDGERLAGETMDNTDYNRLNLDNVGRIEKSRGHHRLYMDQMPWGVLSISLRGNQRNPGRQTSIHVTIHLAMSGETELTFPSPQENGTRRPTSSIQTSSLSN